VIKYHILHLRVSLSKYLIRSYINRVSQPVAKAHPLSSVSVSDSLLQIPSSSPSRSSASQEASFKQQDLPSFPTLDFPPLVCVFRNTSHQSVPGRHPNCLLPSHTEHNASPIACTGPCYPSAPPVVEDQEN